jgi:hypothetical protein
MSTKIIVRNKTDIAQVLRLIDKRPEKDDARTSALLCETVLTHFLDSGLSEISVAVHDRKIDLLARGEEVDFVVPQGADEETRLELEIGLGILESHKIKLSCAMTKASTVAPSTPIQSGA